MTGRRILTADGKRLVATSGRQAICAPDAEPCCDADCMVGDPNGRCVGDTPAILAATFSGIRDCESGALIPEVNTTFEMTQNQGIGEPWWETLDAFVYKGRTWGVYIELQIPIMGGYWEDMGCVLHGRSCLVYSPNVYLFRACAPPAYTACIPWAWTPVTNLLSQGNCDGLRRGYGGNATIECV